MDRAAEGLICSKLGIKYTMLSMLVIYAAGFLLLAVNSSVYLALVWGMVYDMSGCYLIALIVMPVLLVVSVVCLVGAFKK